MDPYRLWKHLDPTSRFVARRFALKLLILLAFAAAQASASYGFRQALLTLLLLSGLLNIILALVNRQRPNLPTLTYWDEALAFLLLGGAVYWIA